MITTIFYLIILLFSVVVHEVSHGAMADYLGDPTAKNAGRLSLNPLRHLDLFGSILLPISLLILTAGQGPIFGWAKPVPINPYNFRDKKWGNLKVALAGPLSNLLLALFFGFLLRIFNPPIQFYNFFSIVIILNLLLAIFNLIPIPPLDGSHIFFLFCQKVHLRFSDFSSNMEFLF